MNKLFIVSALLLTIPLSCNERGEQEIYLLPKRYVGKVIVLFNQENGAPRAYEGKTRLYLIPESGVLKTQFSGNYGWSILPEFYYEEINEKNRIPLQIEATNLSPNKVNATLGSTGVAYKNIDGTGEIEFKECYVGTKEQIEKASKESQVNILDLE